MAQKEKPIYAEVAQASWLGLVPPWVAHLAIEADKESLRKAADKIGYSPAVVSQLFKNAYAGNLDRVRESVEHALGEKIECPVLGLIDGAQCLTHQKAKYRASNHTAVALFVACQRCPNNMNCRKAQP